MKKGETITIYQDPFTRKNPEGKAILIKKISQHYGLERWEVHFLGDGRGENYERSIKKD